MEKPIRILQATVSNDKGGLTGYICQNYRLIDKEKIQFDFLTYEDELDFQEEFEDLGATFYKAPSPIRFLAYYGFLKQIRREGGYRAVHFNMSYANFIPLLAAKLAGYPRIIIHSHSTGLDTPSRTVRMIKKGIHRVGKQLIPYLASDYYACSKLAAEWMFPDRIMKGNRYEVLYNAIDLPKFRFDPEKRKILREKLEIADDIFIVGHVGRFTYQKNHEFLTRIFAEIEKKEPKSLLLLVGDGPDRGKIQAQVSAFGLTEKVKFLGQRPDVADLYQVMDVLVLPSRFEGLCIVAIEAQMSALPAVWSEVLTSETRVSDVSTVLSLQQSPQEWAEEILKKKGISRGDNTEILRKAGYDAKEEIKRVAHLYSKGLYLEERKGIVCKNGTPPPKQHK